MFILVAILKKDTGTDIKVLT